MSEKKAAETTAKETVQAEKPAVATKETAATVIYIGPNILLKGLKKYTVYKTVPTELIAEQEKAFPAIGRLFVDVDALGDAMNDVTTKGTPLYLAFQEITGGVE